MVNMVNLRTLVNMVNVVNMRTLVNVVNVVNEFLGCQNLRLSPRVQCHGPASWPRARGRAGAHGVAPWSNP